MAGAEVVYCGPVAGWRDQRTPPVAASTATSWPSVVVTYSTSRTPPGVLTPDRKTGASSTVPGSETE